MNLEPAIVSRERSLSGALDEDQDGRQRGPRPRFDDYPGDSPEVGLRA